MKSRKLFALLISFVCTLYMSAQTKLSALRTEQRPKIGLVLGGGGAKGAAEIGALRALEEERLEFDYIAGTSIGSIIGALYSCGYRSKDLEELFLSQSWLSLMTDRDEDYQKAFENEDGTITAFGFPIFRAKKKKEDREKELAEKGYEISGFGLNNGDSIIQLFDSLICCRDSMDFNHLPIPFRCVATELRQQEPVVLSSGLLAVAMRASMAIPGVFKPVRIDDKVLVDGGMQNNLPVDVVRQMGAEYVIAIDLTQNKHKPRNISLKETFGIGGIVDWAVSRPDWKIYDENVKSTDLYVNPPLDGYDVMDFQRDKITKMIDIGYKATKAKLMQIR